MGKRGPQPRTSRPFTPAGDGAIWIPLTKGYRVLLDASDWEIVQPYLWHARAGRDRRYVYAATSIKQRVMPMHTLIMAPGPGMEVDHENHDTLNNRRSNLRVATQAQNRANSRHRRDAGSQYKGIVWNTCSWIAQITVNKKNIYLGRFKSELDAALAYDAAALKYFGDFALINFRRTA